MAPIIGVRIWYADGTVATDWDTAPATGVQIVAWLHEGDGVTWAWGLNTYAPIAGPGLTKAGTTIANKRFLDMLDAAKVEYGWMT